MELNLDTPHHGFTFETREDLPEIDGIAYVGRHEPSGARLLYLANGIWSLISWKKLYNKNE